MKKWPKFTKKRLAELACQGERDQQLFWDGACPGLGVRVTPRGAKAFIHEGRVRGTSRKFRLTIGKIEHWSITQARARVHELQRLCDRQIDPRTGLKVREERP